MIQLLRPLRKRLSLAFLKAPVERAELLSFTDALRRFLTSLAVSDTSEFEKHIDHLVYGLFGLAEEEIRIVSLSAAGGGGE